MTLYLVRHAKAGRAEQWAAPDYLRPLSQAGQWQAGALVAVFASFPVGRVLSSPTTRCCATVEPLARARGLKVELDEVLVEGAELGEVLGLAGVLAEREAVVCTHGDIVQGVIEQLVRDGLATDGELRWQKGSTWVLETAGGSFVRGVYLPPPQDRRQPAVPVPRPHVDGGDR